MAQEIELKFIVEKDSVDALRQHLHTLSGEHHEPVQLLNIYYETPDNWLRRHDMGLRIRGASGRYEMTMKIAGRVVGGLHQRPEYNIDISKPELELDRFPAESGRRANCRQRWRTAGAAAVQHRFLARKMAGERR
jgi:triphosphatase